MTGLSSGILVSLVCSKESEIAGRQKEGAVMRRSASGLSFLFALLSAAQAFAQQEPQAAQPASRVARQGSSFDRVSTLRHEMTVGPAQIGQGAPSQRQTSSLGQPQRASQPTSVHVQTTPHTFYPGMRGSQGPNKNVPQLKSRTSGRAGFLPPGMFMNSGAARTSSARSPGKTSR